VKALIVYNCNPAAVSPDQGAVQSGLQREDLFTVVLEHFQTDSADYADYLLPATTQMEHWDILKPYGHFYLALNKPAIAPVGESLPNSEIFRRLAQAMGYSDPGFLQTDVEILRELVENQRHPRFEGITWEVLNERGFIRLNIPAPYLPFAEGNFPTPSGKCEFYSARMQANGYDPLPTYHPPAWQQGAAPDAALICISPPAHSFLNSSFANIERFQHREQKPLLKIHPDDAASRHIHDNTSVQVFNDLGSVILTAQVTTDIIPGTLLAPGIWWAKHSGDGRNINQVTPQSETDMGAGACFYDTHVWVTPVPEQRAGKAPEKVTAKVTDRITEEERGRVPGTESEKSNFFSKRPAEAAD
jgi:anaerobic selenocysteine-containing dehydrogenase